MLAHIDSEGPISKNDLIDYVEENDLPFIADYEGNDPKGKYRKLDSAIIKPPVQDGTITIAERGREMMARITSDGENTLHAFRYMLDADAES